jgi:FlaA1/EpsC-like NDP-sugar epimerase
MTVEEAVQLVIQAGAIGDNGEVLILDMGSPVLIADVARQLADQAERPVEIVYTGLRPGEKVHEDLFGEGEIDVRPRHPLISHVPVPALCIDEAFPQGDSSTNITMALRNACLQSTTGHSSQSMQGGADESGLPSHSLA